VAEEGHSQRILSAGIGGDRRLHWGMREPLIETAELHFLREQRTTRLPASIWRHLHAMYCCSGSSAQKTHEKIIPKLYNDSLGQQTVDEAHDEDVS